ncbi:MAG: M23 family metallopeptidase [Clostridium sp.]|nr:M23 family metallopeptidase [Clostridium sp.]
MNFVKSIIISAVAAFATILTSATPASAQLKLPESHNSLHQDLLANQRPVGDKFRIDASNVLYNSVRDRENAAELNNDIYTEYWESQSVNPYAGATIPQTASIDVSGYYHPVPGTVTSNFGYRPRFGRVHKGIDLRLSIGDTVRAAFDGVVRLTKYEARGYGYYVVIRHDNGMETVYGHLKRYLVKPNQRIRAGEAIALGGNTGRSTGPHLHFETRYMGMTINPTEIIDFEKGEPLADTYAFDKAAYDKQMNSMPKGRKRTYAKKSRKKSKTKKK